MPVAGWCFVDHNTRQDAATRKLIRANAARNHARQERRRNVQEYAESGVGDGNPLSHRSQNDEDKHNGKIDGPRHASPSSDIGAYGSQVAQCRMKYPGQSASARPSMRMLESITFDPFAIGVPAIAYRSEYGLLLHHCKLQLYESSYAWQSFYLL